MPKRLWLTLTLTLLVSSGCVSEPLLDRSPEPTPTRPPAVILDRNGNPPPTLAPGQTPAHPPTPTLAEACDRTGVVSFLTSTSSLYGADVATAVEAFSTSSTWWQCSPNDAALFPEFIIDSGIATAHCYPAASQRLHDALQNHTGAFGSRPLSNMLDADAILCTES